jgi:uncharacterized membrane protein YccC
MPQTLFQRHRAQFGLCLRVTVAALTALALGRYLGFPMVLWAVLSAVILTQMSVGKSLQATIDYFLGTLGGAIYAGAVSAFVPHESEAGLAGVLALAIAPLSLLAALSPRFAAAPTTAAIVVLAPTLIHTTSLASATDRVLEVALGGAIALASSLLVFPTRARQLAKDAAADMLDLIARVFPKLIAGFTESNDEAALHAELRAVGPAFMRLDAVRAEAKHEETSLFAAVPDFDPLRYALLQLRHDLAMIAKAAGGPLPETLRARLAPVLNRAAQSSVVGLQACAAALKTSRKPVIHAEFDEAFDALSAEVAALRREGALRELSVAVVEDVFALSFALEQWRQDLREVARAVAAQAERSVAPASEEAV